MHRGKVDPGVSELPRGNELSRDHVNRPQVSLKEDFVYNDYSLFAEEFIWKSQTAEEFIKSFQFSLATTLSRFWVSQGKEGLCAKQKSSRISLINSSWPELWKINTSANASVFIFHNSGHSE